LRDVLFSLSDSFPYSPRDPAGQRLGLRAVLLEVASDVDEPGWPDSLVWAGRREALVLLGLDKRRGPRQDGLFLNCFLPLRR
jgi:hypothetical protein